MSDILTEQVEEAIADKREREAQQKKFPKGVVLGKDGKPCRSCTSFASWASMTKRNTTATAAESSTSSSSSRPLYTSSTAAPTISATAPQPPPECPPDVEQLGRSTWTLLHSLAASYPSTAPPTLQSQTTQFLSLFSKLYPCWVCAEDFQTWMATRPPEVRGRREFGMWMCNAHNEVNRKLGKGEFDCARWEERWKDGWKDGSCD